MLCVLGCVRWACEVVFPGLFVSFVFFCLCVPGTSKNFLGYVSVQLVFTLLFYWVPLHEPVSEWAFCGLTLALSVITSFEDGKGKLFIRDYVARTMRRLIWLV